MSGVFIIILIFGVLLVAAFTLANITDKTKRKDDSAGCLWPIIMAIIIAIICSLGNCKGCSRGPKGDPGGYWDNFPRHTQMQKPIKSFVKEVIFNTYFV